MSTPGTSTGKGYVIGLIAAAAIGLWPATVESQAINQQPTVTGNMIDATSGVHVGESLVALRSVVNDGNGTTVHGIRHSQWFHVERGMSGTGARLRGPAEQYKHDRTSSVTLAGTESQQRSADGAQRTAITEVIETRSYKLRTSDRGKLIQAALIYTDNDGFEETVYSEIVGPVTGPPSTPGSLTATPTPTTVDLSWTTPSDDGGVPITEYEIRWRTNRFNAWSTIHQSSGSTTSHTVRGLREKTGAFPISRSRAHTHRRHGHPL